MLFARKRKAFEEERQNSGCLHPLCSVGDSAMSSAMFLLCHCMCVSVHVFKDVDQEGLINDLSAYLGDMAPTDAEQALHPMGYPIEGCPMIIAKKKDILIIISKHSGGHPPHCLVVLFVYVCLVHAFVVSCRCFIM